MRQFDTSGIDLIPNAEPVRTAWGKCTQKIGAVNSGLTDAQTTWNTLPSQLTLSGEMADLYGVFGPATTTMGEVTTAVSDTSSAFDTFFEDLERIEGFRSDVHAAIAQYQRDWPDGVDLNPFDRFQRWTTGNGIDGSISMVLRAYDEAQRSLSFNLQYSPVTPPPQVPSYYPGGGDAYDITRANALANGLMDGTSANPEADYRELLALLAGMTPEQIAALGAMNPNLVNLVPPFTTDAGKNREWWDQLGKTEEGRKVQEQLKTSLPALIGNMEGLTYADRNEANQNTLEIMLHRVEQQRAGVRDWGLTETQIKSYENLSTTLRDGGARVGADGVPVGLLSFNPVGDDGHPLAALVIGDLDTATHQSFYIPGMGSSLERNVGGVYGDSETIWGKQRELMGEGESNAMVVWMGYDSPNMPPSTEVLRSTHAREGGERLAYALNGLNEANSHRTGPEPYTSVTAHSYGTTTATYALGQTDHKIDSAVFFGSAGLDKAAASDATALNLETDPNTGRPAVYSGTSAKDWIARIPMQIGSQEGYGPPRYSPTDKGFGGNVFQVDGDNGQTAVGGHDARNDDGTGYLNPGTQSLDSIARLSVGKGDPVPLWDEAPRDQKDDENLEARSPYITTDGAPTKIHQP